MKSIVPYLIIAALAAVGVLPALGSGLDLGLPAAAPGNASGGTAAEDPKPGKIEFADNPDDVGVQPGAPGLPVFAEGIDFTGVRVHSETGDFIRFTLKVKKLDTDRTYENSWSGGAHFFVCFTLNEHKYAVHLPTYYQGGIKVTGNRGIIGTVKGQCQKEGVTLDKKFSIVGYSFDTTTNEIHLRVPRKPLVGPPPATLIDGRSAVPGDAISNVWAIVRDTRPNSLRFDSAPNDAPSPDKLTLVYPTSNFDLFVRPFINAPMTFDCGDYSDIFAYAVEAGGKRGVPVQVSNKLLQSRQVEFRVETQAGSDWKPKIMPRIGVPGALNDDATGNVTVNVIIDTPASAKHKECSTVRVRAIDTARQNSVGETLFNVVSVIPPSPTKNTLYLHTDAKGDSTCAAAAGHAWLNPDPNDPTDAGKDLAMASCGGDESGGGLTPLSTFPALFGARLDVNPSHDIVLNTSATGKFATAVLNLKSQHVGTRAKITAFVYKGSPDAPLGETTKEVTLAEAPTAVRIEIPIHFTREQVGTGDPSRVVDATTPVGLGVRYRPMTANDNVPLETAGRVYLLSRGTQLTLPIWSTIKRNAIDAGDAGGLISLSLLTDREVYANPLGVRVFNLTVLNEAAATDVAFLATTLTGNLTPGWTVQVVPPGPYTLEPGIPQAFAIGVTPPADARESEAVRLDVVASSQSDPTARSSQTLKVTSTRGQELPQGSLGPLVVTDTKDKGFLPALPLLPVLVGVLGALAWASRRRA